MQKMKRDWWLVSAENKILGRLAARIATFLVGKHKPTYTHHIDSGDAVVVINANKIIVTGRKYTEKAYYRHSGYPGGLKKKTFKEIFGKHPEKILYLAVKNMLPKNKLRAKRLKRLKIYASNEHPHKAQSLKPLDVGTY